MADNLKPRLKNAKRRPRALHLEFQEYVVAVKTWDWSYSLSLDIGASRIMSFGNL